MPDFTKITSTSIRWPTDDDVLFAPSPSGAHSLIEQDPSARLRYMIDGYEQAASILIDKASCTRFMNDSLIYPIIFLYRHMIELSLKELIETFGGRVNITPELKGHNLAKLWQKYQEMCKALEVDDTDEASPHMSKIINEFNEVDPTSTSFRYHVDNKGNVLDLKHREIDLVRLRDVMKGVYNYFSGSYSYLWERERHLSDFEAEQAAERRSEHMSDYRDSYYD